jgi:predicted nuclease with TOPRIM domain
MSTTPQSTTPRTDAARGFYDMDTAVSAEDMEQLETELTEVKANFKEERTFLVAEIKELNAEVERLKKDNSDMGTWVGCKMLQPEWDSFKKSLEIIDHWQARAEKAEADTARMDWLEKESPEDWGIRSINRATIDAAMKESSK